MQSWFARRHHTFQDGERGGDELLEAREEGRWLADLVIPRWFHPELSTHLPRHATYSSSTRTSLFPPCVRVFGAGSSCRPFLQAPT